MAAGQQGRAQRSPAWNQFQDLSIAMAMENIGNHTIYTNIHKYVCIYVHVYIYIYICVYIYMYMCIYIYVYLFMYIYIYLCKNIKTYIMSFLVSPCTQRWQWTITVCRWFFSARNLETSVYRGVAISSFAYQRVNHKWYIFHSLCFVELPKGNVSN
jgi:hypothetical protein